MKLQALIDETDLEMTIPQIKAFFLGIMHADKRPAFDKVMDELLAEDPEAQARLAPELKQLWQEMQEHEVRELENFFPAATSELKDFLLAAQANLDYFLTALTLSGTTAESANEEKAELIEYLEETLEELDELLSEAKLDAEQGEELREDLLTNWKEFVDSKQ
jgi:DNA-directed RNA polymerase subunit F